MTDANMQTPSRPELPDIPDISLSAALAYALYRHSDDIGPSNERTLYLALNAAARRGEVVFWGNEQKLAFELAWGPRNAVIKEIDPTYFAADQEAAQRGFDAEYNRINAFCFSDDLGEIQGVIDSDQAEYVSYSNVRVGRDGFYKFFDTFCKSNFAGDAPITSIDEGPGVNGSGSEAEQIKKLASLLRNNEGVTKAQAAEYLHLSPKSRTFERRLAQAYADPSVPRLRVGRRPGTKTKSPHG